MTSSTAATLTVPLLWGGIRSSSTSSNTSDSCDISTSVTEPLLLRGRKESSSSSYYEMAVDADDTDDTAAETEEEEESQERKHRHLSRLHYRGLGVGAMVGLGGTLASIAAEIVYWKYCVNVERNAYDFKNVACAVAVSLVPFLPLPFLRCIAIAIVADYRRHNSNNNYDNDNATTCNSSKNNNSGNDSTRTSSFWLDAILEVEVTFGLGILLVVCLFSVVQDALVAVAVASGRHGDGSRRGHPSFSLTMLGVLGLFFAVVRCLGHHNLRQRRLRQRKLRDAVAGRTSKLEHMKLGATLSV